MSVNFGNSSDFYRRLVEQEQKIDQVFAASPNNADPELIYVFARVKNVDDVQYVRDEILRTFATARATTIDARKLEEAKSNARYSFTAQSRQYRQDRRHARDVSCGTAARTTRSTTSTAPTNR